MCLIKLFNGLTSYKMVSRFVSDVNAAILESSS